MEKDKNMKLYQIVEIMENNNTAGTKAVQDVVKIAEKNGFEPVEIKTWTTRSSINAKIKRQLEFKKEWKKAYAQIEEQSIVLVQNPFRIRQLSRESILKKLKNEKKVKIISIIHDVESLRKFCNNAYYEHEFSTMVALADVLIVHNNKMAKFFEEIGVPKEKLVILKIFDYLQANTYMRTPKFERQITVAGNLDTQKCAYIGLLPQITGIDIQLYGPNFDLSMERYSNIHYGGCFPPDKIPEKLVKGFGLVWDGTGIDKCRGDAGEYLQYNNPHKLSLYLSSGLPVIIWNGAAEAEFVKKNGIGIVVDSLLELSDKLAKISPEEYNSMQKNTAQLALRLRNGYYTGCALVKAIDIVERG